MACKCSLSEWELDELRMLRGRGWTVRRLAAWYGLSERTIQRLLRRMGCKPLRADLSADVAQNE